MLFRKQFTDLVKFMYAAQYLKVHRMHYYIVLHWCKNSRNGFTVPFPNLGIDPNMI